MANARVSLNGEEVAAHRRRRALHYSPISTKMPHTTLLSPNQ
jgi:hypothetical protein